MANKKITELSAASALTGSEPVEAVQGGLNVQTTTNNIGNIAYRGDYSGTTTLPSTGGTFTGGAPAIGNRWRITAGITIGGNFIPPGTIAEAAIDSPGQTLANWNFILTQQFI